MDSIQVEKATNDVEVRYVITDCGIPIPEVATWLDFESQRSPLTGRTYAYAICVFFRFLREYHLDFKTDVTTATIEEYCKQLVFAATPVTQIRSTLPYKGLNKHLTAIKNMYKWLDDNHDTVESPIKSLQPASKYARKYNKTKMLYGQIVHFDIEGSFLSRVYYREPRQYIKWYSKEQIDLIAHHFTNIRDKVMFLLTIETGVRVGELCGLKTMNFDPHERSIRIERDNNIDNLAYAKTSNRTNYLSSSLTDLISQYLIVARNKIHNSNNYLFVNYKGRYAGQPISPSNFLRILKQAAARAGLDPAMIRTHSGRSTRAQQLIELLREHPDSGVTTAFILEDMGWSSERSMKPYLKEYSLAQKQEILSEVQKKYALNSEKWYAE